MFFSVFRISVIGYRHVVFGSRITDIGCKGTKKKLYVQEIRQKSVFLREKRLAIFSFVNAAKPMLFRVSRQENRHLCQKTQMAKG